ncbi:2-amino-4-hydroxy-6-hydroxymethyldihydropteridine diphosphokinase [Gammaproteobacteria bacterium 50_400_T64]|nr:2-amino-4-hydroxy-6-hydroxymethyldihydropteridine diphosphokinase [Gammaproteobacteria bacterium 50_400_T64]
MSECVQRRVYLSLGSNIDREKNILACLDALAEHFGELIISPVYESESVGFTGDSFYNLVVGIDSALSVGELAVIMRDIEAANKRSRAGPKFGPRTLDIDILTCGELTGLVDGVDLPRDEVTENAFVLLPLVDIAPNDRHPISGKAYRDIATNFSGSEQKLWHIDFTWRGQCISKKVDSL